MSVFDASARDAESSRCRIRIIPLPAYNQLEAQWRNLEARSHCQFFLSWSWIGTWLRTLPPHVTPRLVEVASGPAIVGLAVLVERRYRRRWVVPVAGAYLNTTGEPWLDAVTIEYNDLLFDRTCDEDLRRQVVARLLEPERDVDELAVNGVLASAGWERLAPPGYSVLQREDCCRSVDLQSVRRHGEYLSLVSANTRSNVRRTRRDFEGKGSVNITLATDLESALRMFSILRKLHGTTWLERGQQGAFANSFLTRFHHRLIVDCFENGEIQMISIAVGAQVVGVLYNFVFRGRVFSYQSGFDYHFCSTQNRPGLLAHSLAIELNAHAGHDVYDFMAGDSQLKRSLSTDEASMRWVVFQRNCSKFRIENCLRRLRRAWMRRAVNPS